MRTPQFESDGSYVDALSVPLDHQSVIFVCPGLWRFVAQSSSGCAKSDGGYGPAKYGSHIGIPCSGGDHFTQSQIVQVGPFLAHPSPIRF